jgi:MYM-type Zinc finger with FCS sequence motif
MPTDKSASRLSDACLYKDWMPTSHYCCWNCCYPFESVPVYLPVSRDPRSHVFHLSGNFCSWNCAKTYQASKSSFSKKDITAYISVFAFITSHRPKYCPYPIERRHSAECPCIEVFEGVKFAPRKEMLEKFGGPMTIQEFRQGFLIVEKIEWIHRCFQSKLHPENDMYMNARLRDFKYDFYDLCEHGIEKKQLQESEEKVEEPDVLMLHVDESFFF